MARLYNADDLMLWASYDERLWICSKHFANIFCRSNLKFVYKGIIDTAPILLLLPSLTNTSMIYGWRWNCNSNPLFIHFPPFSIKQMAQALSSIVQFQRRPIRDRCHHHRARPRQRVSIRCRRQRMLPIRWCSPASSWVNRRHSIPRRRRTATPPMWR